MEDTPEGMVPQQLTELLENGYSYCQVDKAPGFDCSQVGESPEGTNEWMQMPMHSFILELPAPKNRQNTNFNDRKIGAGSGVSLWQPITAWLALLKGLWFSPPPGLPLTGGVVSMPPLWKSLTSVSQILHCADSTLLASKCIKLLNDLFRRRFDHGRSRVIEAAQETGITVRLMPAPEPSLHFETSRNFPTGHSMNHLLLKSRIYEDRTSSLEQLQTMQQVDKARDVWDTLHDDRYLNEPKSLYLEKEYIRLSGRKQTQLPLLYPLTIGCMKEQVTLHPDNDADTDPTSAQQPSGSSQLSSTNCGVPMEPLWRLPFKRTVPGVGSVPTHVVRLFPDCRSEEDGDSRATEPELFRQDEIKHVDFTFPFPSMMKPQILVVRHLLNAFMTKRHCLSESPTGTGKTLALLSAALAYTDWCRRRGVAVPKIFYLTRTHSQINQTIAEYRRCGWRVKMTVLGSRQRSCPYTVLDGVGNQVDHWCRSGRKAVENLRKSIMKCDTMERTVIELEDSVRSCSDPGAEALLGFLDLPAVASRLAYLTDLALAGRSEGQSEPEVKRQKRVLPGETRCGRSSDILPVEVPEPQFMATFRIQVTYQMMLRRYGLSSKISSSSLEIKFNII
eukprot:GHVH01012938.1.p1 GENE.GHVH01012938.1~~GHVH01012938.1.p1  ORF type:complete len:630 (-),score=61.47 GHVH01012938.1:407-2257(-)